MADAAAAAAAAATTNGAGAAAAVGDAGPAAAAAEEAPAAAAAKADVDMEGGVAPDKAGDYVRELLHEKQSLDPAQWPNASRLLDQEVTKEVARIQSGGKPIARDSKYVDIYREKPIRVAVKVLVPIKEHPKFNFVGKLLGPKGNSMKRLQEDTMTKMAVLGRGSMKDKQKEEELRMSMDPKYAHLSDDLHVEIAAFAPPAEAHARIAYALAEVRKYLIPDSNDEIRQEQMREMELIQTVSGDGAGPPGANGGGAAAAPHAHQDQGAEHPGARARRHGGHGVRLRRRRPAPGRGRGGGGGGGGRGRLLRRAALRLVRRRRVPADGAPLRRRRRRGRRRRRRRRVRRVRRPDGGVLRVERRVLRRRRRGLPLEGLQVAGAGRGGGAVALSGGALHAPRQVAAAPLPSLLPLPLPVHPPPPSGGVEAQGRRAAAPLGRSGPLPAPPPSPPPLPSSAAAGMLRGMLLLLRRRGRSLRLAAVRVACAPKDVKESFKGIEVCYERHRTATFLYVWQC